MSEPNRRPLVYTLYTVMVHVGVTCPRGRYFRFVKADNGRWYKTDDSKVARCDVTSVLREAACVLFHIQQTDLKKDSVTALAGRVNKALGP